MLPKFDDPSLTMTVDTNLLSNLRDRPVITPSTAEEKEPMDSSIKSATVKT